MKKVLILIFSLHVAVVSIAQDFDGYKYIYIPVLNYQDGTVDKWGITNQLKSSFKKKGFLVIDEYTLKVDELIENPCELLVASVEHTNVVYGKNYVTLSITNCFNQIIYNERNGHSGLSVQNDFKSATRKVFSKILNSKYSFNPEKTPEIIFPTVEKTSFSEKQIQEYLSATQLNPIEGIYKSYVESEKDSYYNVSFP